MGLHILTHFDRYYYSHKLSQLSKNLSRWQWRVKCKVIMERTQIQINLICWKENEVRKTKWCKEDQMVKKSQASDPHRGSVVVTPQTSICPLIHSQPNPKMFGISSRFQMSCFQARNKIFPFVGLSRPL